MLTRPSPESTSVNPLTNNPFNPGSSNGIVVTPPVENDFLLLDASNFLLLDGTNFLLL